MDKYRLERYSYTPSEEWMWVVVMEFETATLTPQQVEILNRLVYEVDYRLVKEEE